MPIQACHQSNERKEPMVTENRSQSKQDIHTQIFTLRLWQEQVNGGCWEWRGRVQNVMSGEVRYFRAWSTLVKLLKAMLVNQEQSNEFIFERKDTKMTDTISPTKSELSDRIVFEVEKYGIRLGPIMRVIPPGRAKAYTRGWVGCLGKYPVNGKRCGLSVYFVADGEELPEPFYISNKTTEYRGIFLPFHEMAQYVDLLRNEKPIKALISQTRADWTQLFTSAYEPPGEGEG